MSNTRSDTKVRYPTEACLRMAAQIEQQLLPADSPSINGAEISGWTIYSEMLGGDFFDYHNFVGVNSPSAERINIAVGDACGHGFCSALLMTSVRSYLRGRAMQKGDLHQVVDDINKLLAMDIRNSGHFVSLFYASINGKEKKIDWVRAGHPPALLYDPKKDELLYLYGKGVALGVDSEYVYQSNSQSNIPDGAIVLIGSDGLWEMESYIDGTACKKRLIDLVKKHKHDQAHTIAQVIKKQIGVCSCNQSIQDDISLIVVKFT